MDHPGAGRPAPVAPQGKVIGHLSRLDQLLPVWILLAMALGLLLGRFVPGLQTLLGSVQVGHTSLPIALGLLVMMYPVLAKVRYGELGSVARDRRLLSITLGLTWSWDRC
jgi:ACR3 family arsenite transporter